MAKKTTKKRDELQEVQNALSTSEAFFEKYQKQILYGLTAVVLVVVAIIAYHNLYLQPRSGEAATEISKTQDYFAVDSFRIALDGNLECLGFSEIASSYSSTASGNLANAYAGICSFKLGNYEDAIDYLEKYSDKGTYFGIEVIGLIGDSYVELDKTDKAISYFEKAADKNNDILSPQFLKKAAVAYESLAKPEKALNLYKQIKDKYPQSTEAADIDKYIARLSN
ncbi:MAG: tetratricopeptide repeat protein [Paludibacter sp.]|jgi:tetratricopeptide (TPR) repeat protein|nr:tetratricopeptide repeat protein [Paludibacter sp.]